MRSAYVAFICGIFVALSGAGSAVAAPEPDIILIGEIHDNPGHHAMQAKAVARIAPAAIVFEMLTEDQAWRATPEARRDAQALSDALRWAESGWPDFAMYYPIFQAAPEARIYGAAIPRATARAALDNGIVASFGADAAQFGLTESLPEEEQTAREADQMAAHCNALPSNILPGMVDLQRLRDANLARAALRAFQDTGGPVVVIAGNGHVRLDRGAPLALTRAAPRVKVRAVGQAEAGRIEGAFDEVWPGDAVKRPDSCAAFN